MILEHKSRVAQATISARRKAARDASGPAGRTQRLFHVDLDLAADVERFLVLVCTMPNRFQIMALATIGKCDLVLFTESTVNGTLCAVLVHVSKSSQSAMKQNVLLPIVRMYLRPLLTEIDAADDGGKSLVLQRLGIEPGTATDEAGVHYAFTVNRVLLKMWKEGWRGVPHEP